MRSYRKPLILLHLLAFLLLMPAGFVAAQDAVRPDEFAAAATAIDGQTALVGRYVVVLWGVTAEDIPGTGVVLKARTELDDLLGAGAISCRALQWRDDTRVVAQCTDAGGADLALSMLKKGYVVADRPAVAGSVFEDPYLQAEKQARDQGHGLWAERGKGGNILSLFQDDARLFYGWVIGSVAIPVAAFFILFLMIVIGFSRTNGLIRAHMTMNRQQEERLREREKFVVASMLESELMANRGKLEAYAVIYRDMLKTLRASDKGHKYQQTGEIIHEAPTLNRSVFDGNIGKLELLGPNLARDIVELYGHVRSDPDYMMLESTMSVEDVQIRLDKIISAAEKLLDPIDRIIGGLHIILREEKSSEMAQPDKRVWKAR